MKIIFENNINEGNIKNPHYKIFLKLILLLLNLIQMNHK